MRIDDISIIVEETTFIEREGIQYIVEEKNGDISYFRKRKVAQEYASAVNGELKEV